MLHPQDSPVAGKAIAGTVAAVAGNTLTASVFGAAAFAQTAVGHAFLNGKQDALYYFNLVYSAPLFGTAVMGLLLFLVGGVYTGIAITKSGGLSRWTGWLYAIANVAFAVVSILYNVAQTFTVIFLFASTLVVAWNTARNDPMQD